MWYLSLILFSFYAVVNPLAVFSITNTDLSSLLYDYDLNYDRGFCQTWG